MNISEKLIALRRERNAQLLDAVDGNLTVENLADIKKEAYKMTEEYNESITRADS